MSSIGGTLDFSIKTHVFEGPLELLIELCEKRKLLINDISLAAVTDEYIKQVSEMQEKSLPNTAQFVQLAATLLLIKSKSLLPVLELTKEEEQTIDNLEERLRQYQIYRDAGAVLANRYGKNILYSRRFIAPKDPLFIPDSWCTLSQLHEAMWSVLQNLPKKDIKPKVQVKASISLEDMMASLQRRIETQLRAKFSDIRKEADEHKTVIVGFLAILELVKQGNVLVSQLGRFEDIEIELEKEGIPRYY
ncbi:MAG: segregation/condensation protein A [Candidatus Pacebacteria bacterium]|jgi:segregation and condensation protein A|nr:segregation/condensation protein A [Candidatus Paceibacterota bacterium]